MSPGATSERVYLEIKRRLADGSLALGARIEPAVLSEELFASITPIRDALHRLAGERLIEAPRHNGFRVPAPTESALRDLYHWRGQLLALAVRHSRASAKAGPPQADAQSDESSLFLAIAAQTGSAEHEAAILRALERLAPFGCGEALVLAKLGEELGAMNRAWVDRDLRSLVAQMARHHGRRMRSAPQILAATSAPEH